MTGIFYFSSTGNSLFIAKRIGAHFAEKVFFIPNYHGDINQFQDIVIVSPVYSFGLPKHVYDFVITLPKAPAVYVVLNYGGMMGGADYYTYQLVKKHGVNIRAVYAVKMPENFNEIFFNGYSKIRENESNANNIFEKPALFSLLPTLNNKTVLDLGCGYGEHCIHFVKKGAKRVVGIDISQKMLAIAKAENAHQNISYLNMPMEDIGELQERFDIVVSSLAFHY